MRIICYAITACTMFSLLFWAFTGIPFWAPVAEAERLRALVLIAAHLVGVSFGPVWHFCRKGSQ